MQDLLLPFMGVLQVPERKPAIFSHLKFIYLHTVTVWQELISVNRKLPTSCDLSHPFCIPEPTAHLLRLKELQLVIVVWPSGGKQ